MQAREADATITAVLGHPPEEIAQTFQDPSFGSQPQAVRVPCGAPWDLLVALHHTKPEKGDAPVFMSWIRTGLSRCVNYPKKEGSKVVFLSRPADHFPTLLMLNTLERII